MRLAIAYCPYCGEEDLRPREAASPAESGRDVWECADCRSTFVVTPAAIPARTGAPA